MLLQIACTLLAAASILPATTGKVIEWQPDFDRASVMARESGKPLMIRFTTRSCAPCRQMEREVWPDEKVVERASQYIAVLVDLERDRATSARYQVNAVPTLILTDPWGKVLGRREGYMLIPAVTGFLAGLPGDYSALRESGEALLRNSKDAKALCKFGFFYQQSGVFYLSDEYFNQGLKTSQAKENDQLRRALEYGLVVNRMLQKDWKHAASYAAKWLPDFPRGNEHGELVLVLVMANAHQGRRAEAAQAFQELQAEYPDSRSTQTAAKVMSVK